MTDTIQDLIRPELERYKRVFHSALKTDNPLLTAAVAHLTRKPGKLMRPTLVILCAREGGNVSDSVLHAAAGLELLHTASLVHDDVVDESNMRRGQPSVNALWDNKAAVLVGDFITSSALAEITRTGSISAVERTAWLGRELADGELLQLDVTHRTTFEESVYYDVIGKKTAALFATCARLGAELGGADDERIHRLERFGHLVGLCFQMRDDLFDFGDAQQTGKPAGNDMREGKLTLPVLFALRQAGPSYVALALKVRAGEASEEEIYQLTELAVNGGGLAYAEAEMQRLRTEALALLADMHDADVAVALAHYFDYALQRNQ